MLADSMSVPPSVPRSVLSTAAELLARRHFSGAIAMCTEGLAEAPNHVGLLLVRARCHVALRRGPEAQSDLRDVITLDPACGLAYRLLGELAVRRDENESAAIFFREALRLDPSDQNAADWLVVVGGGARRDRASSTRFASGTNLPFDQDDPPTRPGRPIAPLPAAPARRLPAPYVRAQTPELPGFGEYLVTAGILSLERLRAARAYQRSMKVQLATAIVTLGLATPQRIEHAAVTYQSQSQR